MATHMKTTIEIPDPLLEAARRHAAAEGTTVKALVELGLRRVLAEKRRDAGFRLRPASFKGKGLSSDASGADWQKLREMAYEGHGA